MERYYPSQKLPQQRPPRPQQDMPQPELAQRTRSIVPKELYRTNRRRCDFLEDDNYGYGAHHDTFDENTLQQPYEDRQHHSIHNSAGASLVPASLQVHGYEPVEQERPHSRTQRTRHEFFDKRGKVRDGMGWPSLTGQEVLSREAVRESLNRFEYDANTTLESSSDILMDASSSPTLNAGRRRAGQHEILSRDPSGLWLPKDLPSQALMDQSREAQHYREDGTQLFEAPRRDIRHPFQQVTAAMPVSKPAVLSYTPTRVQGIPIVPVSALPDRLRTVFPFPAFNAVQSQCFNQVFKSNDNFVLSSPTGSGKTAILELAVCRAVVSNSTDQYKVVYQAPTKALCSERHRDWDTKFAQIGLKCAELTGDSDTSDLRSVQSANIIITTPEKWDSMTRKWKDHEKLIKLIKLFLIDEVHILNDDRGAVLEAVVSRMKSINNDVRFVALSATVPNFQDVAAWLGKNSSEPHISAPNERFGEEFRPVKLKKHVRGFVYNSNNDWAFEKQLDARLPEIIAQYSERKPMMIFCATRKSCAATARLIANWSATRNNQDRLWNPPLQPLHIQDKDLDDLVASGVAFHHAGVDQNDRVKVERGFLQGDISVICCTSTLAVGVNLPCHLVIIKNTMSWSQEGLQEYSDLELMQMLGRAGRPQFDDSAVAVIMTRQNKARRYETLVTGEEILESKLHLNLIEHLNAEIGLGTIRDLDSARTWLTGTFLYIRLRQNPVYYRLDGSRGNQDIQAQVDDICFRDIALLKEYNLATGEENLRCTEFGHAMARYYVKFETMKVFMGLKAKSTLSEVLSVIAQAVEFSKIRFRQGEKPIFKTLNKSPSIRFSIPVNLDLPAQKVSLLIQSVLGHADICWDGDANKHKQQYLQEVAIIFKSVHSLIRCVIDCQIVIGDSVSIHSALMLERCLGSKAWDDSPLQMIQIPNIGAVTVRKLVNAGIRGIEDLEATEARRIESVVGRNPPFGLKVLNDLKTFPKLRISLQVQPTSISKTAEGVKVQVKATIGFINEKPPQQFGTKLIYVCVLAETSDGRKIHFARINGSKLGASQSLMFPALLTSAEQKINCYVMCEGIGSMRDATVAPKIATSLFPPQAPITIESMPTHKPNTSKRRIENAPVQRRKSLASDEFGDADIDDDALVRATCEDLDFKDIDDYADLPDAMTDDRTMKIQTARVKTRTKGPVNSAYEVEESAPVQLPNGRWSCNHKCKDKGACKHYCCKHGMDRPPRKAAPRHDSANDCQERVPSALDNTKTQNEMQREITKRKEPTKIEELDLTQQEKKQRKDYSTNGPHGYRDLHSLHSRVQKKRVPASLHSVMHKKPAYRYYEGGEHQLSFLEQRLNAPPKTPSKTPSDYAESELDELAYGVSVAQDQQPYDDKMISKSYSSKAPVAFHSLDTLNDDDPIFRETIVDLADSQNLSQAEFRSTSMRNLQEHGANYVSEGHLDVKTLPEPGFAAIEQLSSDLTKGSVAQHDRQVRQRNLRTPFAEATSSPEKSRHSSQMASEPRYKDVCELQQSGPSLQQQMPSSKVKGGDKDVYSNLLNLLDLPVPIDDEKSTTPQAPVASNGQIPTVKQEKEESPQDMDGFKDLEPWLLQKFGNLVELIDESEHM
ncbi:hypothetical protein OPT61_g3210 [Boeremia exigua]|uniref:Uncharacterized protein n=1 Tax=Boeremia exigua TaxID=749465 RepID=A0ACC2IIR6_9PLEO|nr:hypothetical protein OPT61_g3210 [Boeremia exigua]